jgi:hypothetical protein
MAGTKFKVKKFETYTDSNSVQYEFGAEINQDFPIEAPAGATGKLVVNHDLEVSGNVHGTSGSLVVRDGILLESADETGGPVGLTIRKAEQGSTFILLEEIDTSGSTTIGARLGFQGDTTDESLEGATNSFVLQAKDDTTIKNILKYDYEGNEVDFGGASNLTRIGSYQPGYGYGTEVRGKIVWLGVDSDNDAIFVGYAEETALTQQGSTLTSNFTTTNLNGTDIELKADATTIENKTEGAGTLTLKSNLVNIRGNEVIFTNETNSSVTPTSSTPNHVKILKPLNGSVALSLQEVSSSNYSGMRLVYEGDTTENLGTSDNYCALQAVEDNVAKNILQYHRSGDYIELGFDTNTDIKIKSEDLTIEAPTEIDNQIFEVTSGTAYKTKIDGADITLTSDNSSNGASIVTDSGPLNITAGNLSSTLGSSAPAPDLTLQAFGGEAKLQGSEVTIETAYDSSSNPRGIWLKSDAVTVGEYGSSGHASLRLFANHNFGLTTSEEVDSNASIVSADSLNLGIDGLGEGTTGNQYFRIFEYMGTDGAMGSSNMLLELRGDGTSSILKTKAGTIGAINTFTGSHTYASDSEISLGTAVTLVGRKIVPTDSARSKVCCGIVTMEDKLDPKSLISRKDSFGNTDGWTHLYKVASVGDSRDGDCQGFNVCNENGDIQPGDLLVTSSTPGYLMKQADDIIRACTVGKAMENVVFNEQGQATGVYGYLYCG